MFGPTGRSFSSIGKEYYAKQLEKELSQPVKKSNPISPKPANAYPWGPHIPGVHILHDPKYSLPGNEDAIV